MLNYNEKMKFPQVIIWQQKYGNSYYVANNLEDVADIALHIVKQWKKEGYLDYLKDQTLPQVNSANEAKAKATPWQFAPYTRFDQIKNILLNVKELEKGKTPEILETFFKEFEQYRERWSKVDYWKLKAVHVINNCSGSEYMNVFSETSEDFKKF